MPENQLFYTVGKRLFHCPNLVVFFCGKKNPYHEDFCHPLLEGVHLDVHHVWHHQAGHLPRARPDTSSSPLPLAPWQWGKEIKT